MSAPYPIPDDDDDLLAQCRVETFRSGGAGGQHRDTTESAVRLVHEPTGVRASAQDDRSQHRNKKLALDRLRERLEARNRRDKPRKKRRVSARQKRKRVEEKRRRGRLKKLRKPPGRDDR